MHPEPHRCRRCGTTLAPDARYCSRCGAAVGPASPGMTLLRVLGAIGLAIGAIALGLLGTCFLIGGLSGLSSGGSGVIGAVVMLLLAASAFVGLVRLFR